MRVLILHRPTRAPGGDLRSARNLARAMESYADVTFLPADKAEGEHDWTILYAGCSPDWGFPAAMWAARQPGKFAIVPNWYDRTKRLEFYGQNQIGPGYLKGVKAVLQRADVLFTATMAEALDCWRLAGRKPVHVMGRGYDWPDGIERGQTEDFVICLARLEPAKNQHTLAVACRSLGYPLLCVGSTEDSEYSRTVDNFGGNLAQNLPHDQALELLSHARVHALVSFGESGGNSHIEAGLMGVPGVLGRNPQEVEFFGERGIYADPTDIGDVARALNEAWHRPPGRWVDVPTWDEIARQTIEYMGQH